MQESFAFLLLAAAVGYLAWRFLRRRGAGNCCGEKECPAAREMARKLERHLHRR
jgi:hypothetical protein